MFNRETAKKLRTLVPALNKVLAEHGMAMIMDASITIGDIELSTKVKFVPVAQNGVDPVAAAREQAKKEFELYCSQYGLKPENFGAKFEYGNGYYEVVGIAPGRGKNVVKIKKIRTGKQYVAPAHAVGTALGLKMERPVQTMEELLREEATNERRAMRRMAGRL